MKKYIIFLLVFSILFTGTTVVFAEFSFSQRPFHECIAESDINEFTKGVIVKSSDEICADISSEDLKNFLSVYWDFYYDITTAPLTAFDVYDKYIKICNEDESKVYTIYSNGMVVLGRYGDNYDTHWMTKKNYVIAVPRRSNSVGALNGAWTELEYTYFSKIYEGYKGGERGITSDDEAVVPEKNLLTKNNASKWAKVEIDKAAACNLMLPKLSEKYIAPITRVEFCELIYRLIAIEFEPNTDPLFGIESVIQRVITERNLEEYKISYSDCERIDISELSAMGIISGVGNNNFEPDSYLTREQAATILYRTANFLGNKTVEIFPTEVEYKDYTKIADWAKKAVNNMYEMEIMKGDDNNFFNPQEYYTVEQAIATTVRLYDSD